MLGMGEAEDELVCALRDLRESRVDLVTLGQYLQPTPGHYPVAGYIRPEAFERYKSVALSLGFKAALAGPLVRSSFKAEELYHRCSYA
jgi:lipoic acid synthetase